MSSEIDSERYTIVFLADIHDHLETRPLDGSGLEGVAKHAFGGARPDRLYGGVESLSPLIKSISDRASRDKRQVILVNAGDICTGSWHSPLSEGRWAACCLNDISVDTGHKWINCLGNHELDYGPGALEKIGSEIGPIYCHNLAFHSTVSDGPISLPTSTFPLPFCGINFVFITTSDTIHDAPGNDEKKYASIHSSLPEIIARAKEIPRPSIAITHLSDEEDTEVSDAVDIVLGGHSHTELSDASKRIFKTLPFAQEVGYIDLAVRDARIEIEAVRFYVRHKKTTDPKIKKRINAWKDDVRKEYPLFFDKLCEFYPALASEADRALRTRQTRLGEFVAKTIYEIARERTKPDGLNVDCAFINAGNIRCGLPSRATYGDIYCCLPPNWDYELDLIVAPKAWLCELLKLLCKNRIDDRAGFFQFYGLHYDLLDGKCEYHLPFSSVGESCHIATISLLASKGRHGLADILVDPVSIRKLGGTKLTQAMIDSLRGNKIIVPPFEEAKYRLPKL